MRTFLKGFCLFLCALNFPLLARANGTASITLSPGYTVVATSATVQYVATVSGLANTNVTWEVNRVIGGNATYGTISSNGLYKAPATVPPGDILVIAVASDNSTVAAQYIDVRTGGPNVNAITPASIPVGSYSVTLTGSNFQPGSIAYTTGTSLATTFVNSTTLIASGYQGATGAYAIQVTNPGSTMGPAFTANFVQPISPATATVSVGHTQQFTWTGATNWSASAGSITSTGLYTAPASMPSWPTVYISANGPGGSGTAVVTLSSAPPTVAPTSATILLGRTQQFTATGATGWSASAGTITSTGLYTAPATMPASGTATVTATGPGGSTSAIVTLSAPEAISPANTSVILGKTQQFSATGIGTTSWSASAGTVTSAGLYTAPATMPASGTATVTAVNLAGSANAKVTLIAPQAISPVSATIILGQTQQFTSAGATSWTASAGTVSSNGLFTAPTTMPASSTVSVTATGPGGPATASVALVAPQTISPTTASVSVGSTLQFTSTGATSWTASAGTVSSSGLYTAPATMPASAAATVTATGPGGSATAAITLTAVTTKAASGISISTENPPFGWQVIPGATRRIHATVTSGSSNEVTWSYTTTGGATATLTPAPSPNILGAFVDVTLGSVGGTCTNVGTDVAPVFSSPATVTLTATSVDDRTKSVTVPIHICNPTVQAFVSPFNERVYSGQTVNLQSWVWGAVNDNVTWTITQASGGNGKLIAPPSGGSATTARDAVFSATVAGDYTVTATSVANPSISASALISVDSAGMPSYAVTPNHTEPVDCSVDPAQAGKSYDVGAGHAYASLAAVYAAIGSNVLNAGTTIRLFNTDTTGANPTHYHEYLRIDGTGTETAPIRVVGCADSSGNLPVMDAANATAFSPTDNSATSGIAGLYQIAIHRASGSFGLYPNMSGTAYIIVEGLAFRNAYPTATNGTTNSYYAPGGSTPTQWSTSASCIRPYEGDHITVRGNDMQDCGFGILADFNGNNAWGGFFGDFSLQGNYFTNIGTANQTEHMAYVQGYRQIIQGNFFDQLKSVSQAGELKLRGVAEIVRYNTFNTSTNTRTIDFVEDQDSNMYMSFFGYYYTPTGSISFHTEYPSDGYTPDMIAAADEAWHKAYAYGNIINYGPGLPASLAPIHFFGDQGSAGTSANPPVRMGDLFAYNNTFYSVGGNSFHLVDTQQNGDNEIRAEWPVLDLWNNAIYVGPISTNGGSAYQMSTLRSDIYNLGPNWLSSNWGTNALTCTNDTGGACLGTGWPYQEESTQYMDGANLPAHINGLSNLIIGGSTAPFSTTTWVPTSGGGLINAGAALPASMSNMPVRFQMSGYALTPRTDALTLGAHD